MKLNFRVPVRLFLILFVLLIIASCKKSSNPTSGFTWNYKGINYSAVKHGAHLYYPGTTNSFYRLDGLIDSLDLPTISILLRSINTGVYNMSTTGASLYFSDEIAGTLYDITSGTINITSNSNNLISGNFSVIIEPGGINQTLTGTFTNIILE